MRFGFTISATLGILSQAIGQYRLLRKETNMSMDARETIVLTDEARKKIGECVAALAASGFGPDGPGKETAFIDIEDFGHEVGRMVAQAVDERLATQHAAHFQEEAPCPTCETRCAPKEQPVTRSIQTTDGDVPLQEIVCHCPVCDRDFFPGADRIED
jgi:hypothetical protein